MDVQGNGLATGDAKSTTLPAHQFSPKNTRSRCNQKLLEDIHLWLLLFSNFGLRFDNLYNVLFITIHFLGKHYTFLNVCCRLGEDSAKAYRECPIDHWSKKRQASVEDKASLATEYTDKYSNTAMNLLVNIYNTYNVCMLQNFLGGLHFINDFFRAFAAEYFSNICYPRSITVNSREYFPRLLDMYQHDCHALLSDIMGFARQIKRYLACCKNVVRLNKYILIAHTVAFYLEDVKMKFMLFGLENPGT